MAIKECVICGSSFCASGNTKVCSLSCSNLRKQELSNARRASNQEKLREYQRVYYAANQEKLREYHSAYRAANRDKIAAQERAYRAANRDKIAAKERAYRAANQEKCRENSRNFKIKARRQRNQARLILNLAIQTGELK